MPLIRCPGCGHGVKVAPGGGCPVARCPACGYDVPAHEAARVKAVPAHECPAPPVGDTFALVLTPDDAVPRRPGTRRSPGDGERPPRRWRARRHKKVHGLLALAVAGPACLVLLLLALISEAAGVLACLTGLGLMVGAIIMAYLAGRDNGFNDELDAVPFYARGGIAFVFLQVVYAVKDPRRLACWVFLEFFGIAVMITGGTLAQRARAAAAAGPVQTWPVNAMPR